MSLRRRIIHGGGAVAIGQIVGQGGTFLRSVILARILTREHFGVAATFALTVSLLEMVSNLAVDRLLVQADDGDDDAFQGTAHLFQALRGVIIAAILVLVAAPFAQLFDVPEATWAFRVIALVPLIRAGMHLDVKRLHRSMRFGPDVLVETAAQLIPTLIAWPLAVWLQSYAVVVWLLIVQAVVQLVVSHLAAERRYRMQWDRAVMRRMVAFGWPLLLDGILVFGMYQGDRLIVGAAYDMDALGQYAVAFGLALVPAMVMARVLTSVFLPVLAQARDDGPRFAFRYAIALQVAMAIAALLIGGTVLAADNVIELLYGAKYAGLGALMSWIMIGQALRIVRQPAILAAMAHADTRSILLSNVARTVPLAGAVVVALRGAPLEWVAVWGIVGEALALVVILGRLQAVHRVAPGSGWRAVVGLGIVAAGSGVIAAMRPASTELFVDLALCVPISVLAILVTLSMRETRREMARVLTRRRIRRSGGAASPGSTSDPDARAVHGGGA